MKEIKSGSFVLSFTLDETYYWLRMIKEEEISVLKLIKM